MMLTTHPGAPVNELPGPAKPLPNGEKWLSWSPNIEKPKAETPRPQIKRNESIIRTHLYHAICRKWIKGNA